MGYLVPFATGAALSIVAELVSLVSSVLYVTVNSIRYCATGIE
jgi:hypothetical protein